MAYVSANTVAHNRAVTFVSAFVADAIEAFKARRLITRTYNELSNLTDRELNDLGISRSEISDIARSAVRG